MPLSKLEKTPWPYFGGKSGAADAVWAALGDVRHYVEPFAGSLAVLMRRPHLCNRPYHSETVNDIDGLLCNAWRSIQISPEETARAASWPVCEADLTARHLALVRWRESRELERLMGDPDFHDPLMAGWWIWGQCAWIGSGWCSGRGPWVAGADGRIWQQPREGARAPGVNRNMPHISNNGKGINHAAAREPGVNRNLPHISNDGKGINHAAAREPGVNRKLPHISNDGKGINRPAAREPGVSRNLPHISNGGMGVNRPTAREPGVNRNLPHIGNDGKGINHAAAREPGVSRKRPHISDDGKGINRPAAREPGVTSEDLVTLDTEYHPMTMPELTRWLAFLSARLRHVRILNGAWTRSCTGAALKILAVRAKGKFAGVYLDPPYDKSQRVSQLYSHDARGVSDAVREWCVANGSDPKLRIVLSGYDGEHDALQRHGWRVQEWFQRGYLTGGMANTGEGGSQSKRERLWISPHCLAKGEES